MQSQFLQGLKASRTRTKVSIIIIVTTVNKNRIILGNTTLEYITMGRRKSLDQLDTKKSKKVKM